MKEDKTEDYQYLTLEGPSNKCQQLEEVSYEDIDITNFPASHNIEEEKEPFSKVDIRSIKYKSSTEHLNCPICQQPFIQPLTTICSHSFCRECIFEYFKLTEEIDKSSCTCPLDRTPLNPKNVNDVFPTPLIISNLIDDLQVYCLNSERGCPWVGNRWEVEHHVLADCPYTGVLCNGERKDAEGNVFKCNLYVERRFTGDGDECVHKQYECKKCSTLISKVSEDYHLSKVCDLNFQNCEMCSNDMIPLKNLEKHKLNCQKVGHQVCPAKKIGCIWVGNNEASLDNHLSVCSLYCFLPHYDKLNDKVTELTEENKLLQRLINKILDMAVQGKITNLGFSEFVEEIDKCGSIEDQNRLLYMNFELERLKFDVEEKIIPYIQKYHYNEREAMINSLANDNMIMKEDLNHQRILMNSIRKQLQFLMYARNNSRIPIFEDHSAEIFDGPSRSSSEERLNLKL